MINTEHFYPIPFDASIYKKEFVAANLEETVFWEITDPCTLWNDFLYSKINYDPFYHIPLHLVF